MKSDTLYLAAVDIGGTKITVSLAGNSGILVKVYELADKEGDNRAVPRQVDRLIRYACEKAGIKKDQISRVGISACGPFGKDSGKCILLGPNLCGGLAVDRCFIPNNWLKIPLEDELSKYYKDIKINNDAVSGAIAERLFGAGTGENNLVYVTWSTGIGAGAYVDGNLIMGKNNNAMHFGHTFITNDILNSPLCGCGESGHIESFVSGPSIERDYGIPAREVFEKYNTGDKKARNIIQKAVKIFTLGLVNLTCILDTKLIILGGSVCKNWDILGPLIKEQYYKISKPFTKEVKIVQSSLGDFLGDIAALSIIMPKEWIPAWQKKCPWEKAPKTIKL